MALFENHDSSTEIDLGEVYGSLWESQIFTASSGHTVSSVKLKLRRTGTLTGRTFTVSIKAVDGSYKPTGADLCSVAVDPSGYSTSNTLIEYTFSSPATLSNGTSYAIVMRLDGGDASNKIDVVGTGSPGSGVSNEKRTDSADSGSSWTTRGSTYEFFVYGVVTAVTITINGTMLVQSLRTITPILTKTINSIVAKLVTGTLDFTQLVLLYGTTIIQSGGILTVTITKTIYGGTIKLVSRFSSLMKGIWSFKSKNSSAWTHKTKNISTFTNKTKNTSSWTNKNKNA